MNSEPARAVARLTVLVVDDSKVMRMMVIRSLRMSQLELERVLEAENGQAALDVIARDRVDLVLSDLHMPILDGVDLIARLKEHPATAKIPVVMVSSQRDEAMEQRLLALGVSAYLHKPFQPETLDRIVRAALALEDKP